MTGQDRTRPRHLQNRVVAIALLGMLGVGVIIAMAGMWPLYGELRDREERALLQGVESRVATLDEYLSSIRRVASQVTSRTKAREKLEAYNAGEVTLAEFRGFSAPILNDAIDRSTIALGITRLDAQGDPVIALGEQAPSEFWPIPPAGSTEAIAGRPLLHKAPPMIAAGAPILDRAGRRVGTDIVFFDASTIERIMALSEKNADGIQLVLAELDDGGSRPIVSARAAGMPGAIDLSPGTPLDEAIRKARRGERGVFSSAELNAVVAYAPVPGMPWAVATTLDENVLETPLKKRLRGLAALLLSLIVAGTAGVVMLVRPLTKGLVDYSEALEKEVERRARVEDALRAANAEIEQRVEARTRELVETNASLEWEVEARKQTEAALQVARGLAEDASRAKSEFLANMSHELRTPLNAIIGYAELLLEDHAEGEDEALVADLKKIRSAGAHLLDVINDVLDLSKIEAGKVEFEVARVEISALVTEVVSVVAPLVEQNGNTLEVDCPNGVGQMRTDPAKLRQILLNLLGNAAKFTNEGRIGLEVEREDAGDGRHVVFRVWDEGVGMTPEQCQRIFNPFTQADASTARDFGGTGLGLTIVRRYCDAFGGDINVESTPGEGSKFSVRLPDSLDEATSDLAPAQMAEAGDSAAPAKESPDDGSVPAPGRGNSTTSARGRESKPAPFPAAPIAPGTDGDGELVLVIDDDPVAVEVLSRHLVQLGCDVVSALNGETGLRTARELKPDLITLDVMMPGLDGWECLQRLKADGATARIPVILSTIVDDRSKGFALGATDYLRKPVDRDHLATILEKFHAGTRVGRVLVVEDDAPAREILRRMLAGAGWMVSEAENGREALERVAEAHPDVILLDIKMPVMNGFEFLDRLRLTDGGRSIPVVVITAAELTTGDRARLSGAVLEVLEKGGESLDDLLAKVNALVGQALRHDR